MINKIQTTNEQQLLLENKNGKNRSNGEPSTPRADEDYCNEALKADHLLLDKATKPEVYPKIQK